MGSKTLEPFFKLLMYKVDSIRLNFFQKNLVCCSCFLFLFVLIPAVLHYFVLVLWSRKSWSVCVGVLDRGRGRGRKLVLTDNFTKVTKIPVHSCWSFYFNLQSENCLFRILSSLVDGQMLYMKMICWLFRKSRK